MSKLYVDEIRHSGGAVAAMQIDSSGRILTPARPAFRGKRNDIGVTDYTTETDMASYTENFDIGGGFNPTTGIYTVPVTGLYHITFNLTHGSVAAATDMTARLYVNTNDFQIRNDPQAGSAVSLCYSSVRSLTAGDELKVTLKATGDTTITINDMDFSGYLVG
jgi:hypothetical protein